MKEPEDIRILGSNLASGDVYGYYRTKEGRDFLKELLPMMTARIPTDGSRSQMKDYKIATLICDHKATSPEFEINRTKSALARWRDGQNELWQNDQEMNERCLLRLEQHMMAIDECREVLEDQAATIIKIDIGEALSNMMYGLGLDNRSRAKHRLNEFPIRVAREARIDFQSGKPIFHEEDNFPSKIHCFFKISDRPFLLSQTVKVIFQGKKANIVSSMSGFAFLATNGEIYRFMWDRIKPKSLIFEQFSPGRHSSHNFKNSDVFPYTYGFAPFPLSYQLAEIMAGQVFTYSPVALLSEESEKLNYIWNSLEKSKWDIVL